MNEIKQCSLMYLMLVISFYCMIVWSDDRPTLVQAEANPSTNHNCTYQTLGSARFILQIIALVKRLT